MRERSDDTGARPSGRPAVLQEYVLTYFCESASLGPVRTTLEIPDSLFRRSKAAAALAGLSLKEFVANALRAYLARHGEAIREPSGWRAVYGRASPEEVAEVDRIVEEEFGRVDPEDWE